jgi:hypothetical protein
MRPRILGEMVVQIGLVWPQIPALVRVAFLLSGAQRRTLYLIFRVPFRIFISRLTRVVVSLVMKHLRVLDSARLFGVCDEIGECTTCVWSHTADIQLSMSALVLGNAQQRQFNKDTYLKLWASSWTKAPLNATRTPKRETGKANSDDLRALDCRSSLSYTTVRFVTCRLRR